MQQHHMAKALDCFGREGGTISIRELGAAKATAVPITIFQPSMLLHDLFVPDSLGESYRSVLDPPDTACTAHTIEVTLLRF